MDRAQMRSQTTKKSGSRANWLRNLFTNHIMPDKENLHKASKTRMKKKKIAQLEESEPVHLCGKAAVCAEAHFCPFPSAPPGRQADRCHRGSSVCPVFALSGIKRLQHWLCQTERSLSGFELLPPDSVTEEKMGFKIDIQSVLERHAN